MEVSLSPINLEVIAEEISFIKEHLFCEIKKGKYFVPIILEAFLKPLY